MVSWGRGVMGHGGMVSGFRGFELDRPWSASISLIKTGLQG